VILFLVNPGRQSRHYILGLIRAAERTGLPHITIELGRIWDCLSGASDKRAALQSIHVELARLVATHRVTHALGYVYNGTFDIGLVSRPGQVGRALFPSLGVRHILLWTDHPEWASEGVSLRPPLLEILRDPMMVHIVKSEAAAAEAREVLGWPNITSMPMAEDYDSFRPVRGVEPVHDAVAILGDARGIPPAIARFLDEDDPDPAAIDDVMRGEAVARFAATHADARATAEAWLDVKRAEPLRSFWWHSRSLDGSHAGALSGLRGNPEVWYNAISSLRVMVEWRRYFWPAWLARRMNVGVYGSNASGLGIRQEAGAAEWVAYEQQSAVYARGRVAINTNAAHDEEGLTHKPFQIAASGVAMVHHRTRGLEACFDNDEVATFGSGRELLEKVKQLAGDERLRRRLAEAARERAVREHTWEERLTRLIRGRVEAAPVA
jgi:hypothetical protein